MYNDSDYLYKVDIKGKDFFLKLDFDTKTLYSWESAVVHLAEGAGGSASFQKVLTSEGWQSWIQKTWGDDILTEVLEKIKKALKEH